MNLKNASIFLIVILTLSSCGNYTEKKTDQSDQNLNFSIGSVDYRQVQSKIFAPKCLSCHQQYGTYAGIRRELDAISSAIHSGRMPKTGGPLESHLKQLFQSWVANGAPETAGVTPPPVSAIIEPTWQSINENIISPKCLVCHQPNGQAKFLDLSNRQAIFANRNTLYGDGDGKAFINFDDPEHSYLIDILRDEAEPMPPIWSNIQRLNQSEINSLITWIGLGLP